MATLQDVSVRVSVDAQGVVRSTMEKVGEPYQYQPEIPQPLSYQPIPTREERQEANRARNEAIQAQPDRGDEYQGLDPTKLYIWYVEKPTPCIYCGAVLPYYTALPDFGYADRQEGDMRCMGQWHSPIVSRPEHLISDLQPVPLEGSGFAYEQCADLSKLSDELPRASETVDPFE